MRSSKDADWGPLKKAFEPAPLYMAIRDRKMKAAPDSKRDDLYVSYEVWADHITFTPLVEGVDFEFAGSVPVDGTRDEVAIRLLGDPADRGAHVVPARV